MKEFSLVRIFNEIEAFRNEKFPEYGQLKTLHKLKEEVDEAIRELEESGQKDTYNLRMEYADMLILLFGAWAYNGNSINKLLEATEHKMYINKFRNWSEDD